MGYFHKKKISQNLSNVQQFFSSSIFAIEIQSDNKLLIGGPFINYGLVGGRSYLAKLNSMGIADIGFSQNVVDVTKFNNAVNAIKVQSDGKILIGGAFSNYAGTTGRNYLIRLNSDDTIDTNFCINAVDGAKFSNSIATKSIVIQSDGKILVGGSFTNYGGTTGRNRLIRLNSDGTLDTDFCVNAVDGSGIGSVETLVVQSDNKILVGGFISNYKGTTGRNRLIRLNSDGTLDTDFCVNAADGAKFNGNPSVIAIQPDAKILVGGAFTDYAGTVGRNRLIRLNSDGTLDTAFCVNAADATKFSSNVLTITVQSNGKILIGGLFLNYAGTTGRDKLIRLNSDGTLDTTFCSAIVDGVKFNNTVNTTAVQSDGKILIGGGFSNYAGTTGRNYLIRLNSDDTIDTNFCKNTTDNYTLINNNLNITRVQPDGKILIGGAFTNYGGVTGRDRLVRFNSDRTLDTAFCVNAVDGVKFNNSINYLTVQPDGKILIGGSFSNYAGTTGRNYFIRLNSDGTLDTTFCVNAVDGLKFTNIATSIEVQSDGKILIGGLFISYGGTTGRNRLIRLNSDGTLDNTFCVNATDNTKFNNTINSIAVQLDGKILVGGGFTAYAGTTNRNYLIRLNSDGTLDTVFCASIVDGAKFQSIVYSIIVQSDGKILIGGLFLNYAGTTGRNYLIRLNSDDTIDTNFCINAVDGAKFSSSIYTVKPFLDGKIIIGGLFTNYGGTTGRNNLIILNLDGTPDNTFCINAVDGAKINSSVSSVSVGLYGVISIVGAFINYRNNIYTKAVSSRFTLLSKDGYLT